MGNRNLVMDTKESAASLNNSSQNFDGSCVQSPQVNLFDALKTLPVLGLQLTPTPSLLDKVNQILLRRGFSFNGEEQANNTSSYAAHALIKAKSNDSILQQANKLKAENFSISLLRIGSWERVTRNEGDLVAKCYFAKRKLVWEFLENGLKSKIEVQWSDILSLKAVCHEGQSGILEIELMQPPLFYHEIDPKPRKHTQWRIVPDFTGGQAPTYRRHYLEFSPGVLDRPIEKLLRCDSRLFQLSRQGFPSLKSPFFPKHPFGDFSFDFGSQFHIDPQQQQQQQQLSFSNVPIPYQTYEPAPLNSPLSEFDNNQMPSWDSQGVMMSTMPSNASSSISFQNNYMQLSQNQLGGLVSMEQQQQQASMFRTLNDHHQNMLMNNSQIGFSTMVDNSVLVNNALSNNVVVGGGQMYPELMIWSPDNNSFSSLANNDDLIHEINNWTHACNRNKWQ